MTEIKDTQHIGDGVYVGHDGYQLWVRANDHHWHHPMLEGGVALEPRVIIELYEYALKHGYALRRDNGGK